MGESVTIETLARKQADNVTVTCNGSNQKIVRHAKTGTASDVYAVKEHRRKQRELMERRAKLYKMAANGKRASSLQEGPGFENYLLKEEKILGMAGIVICVSVFMISVSGVAALVAYLDGWQL
ncbi:hypothetical protein L596_030598 [Steinernema carpocapsae]|uniref:Uncharacterized protein n=1 Tax=Steinernema carpocapsae TaxID=34508 RepID=A0A4U5LPW5_STECR|nr:hypothetical protein L596_030598 [Steinernema carpocapsae]